MTSGKDWQTSRSARNTLYCTSPAERKMLAFLHNCINMWKMIFDRCSLESLRHGDSNEHPQHRFLRRFDQNYLSIIIKYAPYLFFWWTFLLNYINMWNLLT